MARHINLQGKTERKGLRVSKGSPQHTFWAQWVAGRIAHKLTGLPAASKRPMRGPRTQAAARDATPPTCVEQGRAKVSVAALGAAGSAGRAVSNPPYHVHSGIASKVVDAGAGKVEVRLLGGGGLRPPGGQPAAGGPHPVGDHGVDKHHNHELVQLQGQSRGSVTAVTGRCSCEAGRQSARCKWRG